MNLDPFSRLSDGKTAPGGKSSPCREHSGGQSRRSVNELHATFHSCEQGEAGRKVQGSYSF